MNDRITIVPVIYQGKPCISGLRYPVENVLKWLASGKSIEGILATLSLATRLAHVKRQ